MGNLFPYFMRLGASGPKNGGSLLKSIDLRGIAKIRANNRFPGVILPLVSRNDKMKNYIKPFRTKKSRKQLIFLAIKYIFKHTDIHVNFYEWSLICKNGKIKKD